MTTTDYTTDTFLHETRITLASDVSDLPRLQALAEHFWGRKTKTSYLFTPHRGMLFDKLYRAGFGVRDNKLVHPRVPSRVFSSAHAIQAVLIAEKMGLDSDAPKSN